MRRLLMNDVGLVVIKDKIGNEKDVRLLMKDEG